MTATKYYSQRAEMWVVMVVYDNKGTVFLSLNDFYKEYPDYVF